MQARAVSATRLAAILALACAAWPAAAVDGVVLIDQNRALAGAVTPGDTAGYPIGINLPGSYRLSGNLTVPLGVNAIEINADGVTLDLNGFAITGPGLFPNGGFAAVASTRQRIAVQNGSVSGFVQGMVFNGDARFIRLERLLIDGTVRRANGDVIGGLGAKIGENRASHAVVDGLQAIGQVQITCPGLVRNSVASIVELVVPPNGTGVGFPTNCRGDQVISAPLN